MLLEHTPHPCDLARCQRNHVGDAPHEAVAVQTRRPSPLARRAQRVNVPVAEPRRRRVQGIGNEQAGLVQQDQRARKVAPELEDFDAGQIRRAGQRHVEFRLVLPVGQKDLLRARQRQPPPVLRRQVDGAAAESAGPRGVRRVVVRVGNDNGGQPAELADLGLGRRVQQRHAVPEHVAGRRADQDGALANGELGLRDDGNKGGLIFLLACQ